MHKQHGASILPHTHTHDGHFDWHKLDLQGVPRSNKRNFVVCSSELRLFSSFFTLSVNLSLILECKADMEEDIIKWNVLFIKISLIYWHPCHSITLICSYALASGPVLHWDPKGFSWTLTSVEECPINVGSCISHVYSRIIYSAI